MARTQDGVLEETLAYYRQLFTASAIKPEWGEMAAKAGGPISVPTLYLHGQDDGCIGLSVSEGMEAQFTGGLRKVVVPQAGHFLQLEQPNVEVVASRAESLYDGRRPTRPRNQSD